MEIKLYSNIKKKPIKINWDELSVLNKLLTNEVKLIEDKTIADTKYKISNLKNYFPLYNIKIKDIEIIPIDKVKIKILNENYRIIDNILKKKIIYQLKKYKKNKLSKNQKIYYNKLQKMLNFINNIDIKLIKTLINNKLKIDLSTFTNFEKISYLPFMADSIPYYSKTELIKMGLNFNDFTSNTKNINTKDLLKLYNKIIVNDFDSTLLLKNLHYINKNNAENLVKFYTFHGSYYINSYLRDRDNLIKDNLLEAIIKNLWKVILKSPIIKTQKFVYRFVYDDFFLKNLKINDVYYDYGFLSTTRNQFYNIDSEKFGYILLKIIIPKSSKGCLCVEPYSLFSDEEEIILPPLSKLKLVKKNENVNYHHVNDSSQKKIKKKYEFIFLGSEYDISILKKEKEKIPEFNFLNKIEGKNLGLRIKNFFNKVKKVNTYNKFYLKIKNKKYLFYCDFYDSTDVYSQFYSLKNNNGFYIYSLNKQGQYEFFIEIDKQIYVNYFMKFGNSKFKNDYNVFLDVIALVCNAFNVKNAILFNNYQLTNKFYNNKNDDENLKQNSALINNFNYDIYYYLKNDKMLIDNNYVFTNFNFFYLKILVKFTIEEVINKENSIELLNIYNNNYKGPNTIKNFYIYIIENYWFLIKKFNDILNTFYQDRFDQSLNFSYIFNSHSYLYEKFNKFFKNVKYTSRLKDDSNFIEFYIKNHNKKLKSLIY